MSIHFIAWNPRDAAAFHGRDERSAINGACNRFGTVMEWEDMVRAGWRVTEVRDTVRNPNRHYGLLVGDVVEYRRIRSYALRGVVTELHLTDNNGATIRLDDGSTMKVVCEWCNIIEKADA